VCIGQKLKAIALSSAHSRNAIISSVRSQTWRPKDLRI